MSEATTSETTTSEPAEPAGRGGRFYQTLDPAEPIPDPYSLPLEDINMVFPRLFQEDAIWPYFERLRKEDPVHYNEHPATGPCWSLTRYKDIKAVDSDHERFSSANGITIGPKVGTPLPDGAMGIQMFIAMDQPKHDEQRATVAPIVAPMSLKKLESTIRSRCQNILDSLPVGETFNWVDKVSIELTTQMLATLFDFPFEERRRLTRWSDIATAAPGTMVESEEQRRAELLECLDCFTQLFNERKEKPGFDLISMLAHGEATKNMQPFEFLGNLMLLIVGGNDTTRNSISGGVLALNQFPDQYDKLRDDTSVIPNMVAEIIRWQTPLAYMRRTANEDCEIGGKQISQNDQILMWYVSGNRDEDMFENANKLIIDRKNARQHLSFGFGLHRCMGNRLAEMQLRVIWEEIMKRFEMVEVVGEPQRTYSSFVKGYTELPVILHPKAS